MKVAENQNRKTGQRAAVIALGLGGLMALVVVLCSSDGHPEEHTEAHSSAPSEAIAYDFEYRATQRAEEGELALAGEFLFEGEVELRDRGRTQGRSRVGLVITRCDEARWSVLGETFLADAADCETKLRGNEVVAELDQGTIVRLHVPRDLGGTELHLLRGLWQELAFRVEPDARYTHAEETPRGTAEARFERAIDQSGQRTIERVRTEYRTDVHSVSSGQFESGEATLTLDEEGHHSSLTLREHFAGVTPIDVRLDMRRVGHRTVAAQDPAEFREWQPSGDADATRQALLEQRVGSMTTASFLESLVVFGDGARFPDHERFLWQAAALMRLHPELAGELEPLFYDNAATDRRRALLIDLLTNADTPEGQASMRTLLDSDIGRSDAGRHYWVQRIGHLRHPDAATLEWIEARLDHATGQNDRLAAAYAFAASSARTENREHARARLENDLANVSDDTERYHYVRALGATQAPNARDALLRHTDADDGRVRLAALEALGTHEAYGADPQVFVTALADPSAAVQLEALEHVNLDRNACATLEELAGGRQLNERNIESLVRRMARAEANADLRALAETLTRNGYARGRVAPVLARLAQPS